MTPHKKPSLPTQPMKKKESHTWSEEYAWRQCKKMEARKRFWSAVKEWVASSILVVFSVLAGASLLFGIASGISKVCDWVSMQNELRVRVEKLEDAAYRPTAPAVLDQ